jgi:hypothetical protein
MKFNVKANNSHQLELLVEMTLYYWRRCDLTFVLYTKKHAMVPNLFFLHIREDFPLERTCRKLLGTVRTGQKWTI